MNRESTMQGEIFLEERSAGKDAQKEESALFFEAIPSTAVDPGQNIMLDIMRYGLSRLSHKS